MSQAKDKLKETLERMTELLSVVADSIEPPRSENVPAGMVQSMRMLSDSIHIKVSSLPKDVEHVRISKLNAVLLTQVISKWSTDLENLRDEYNELAKALSGACEELERGSKEFEADKDVLLGLIDEVAPELNISRELSDAERA